MAGFRWRQAREAAQQRWRLVETPAELLPKLTAIRESIDLESSVLMQQAVAEFVLRGELGSGEHHYPAGADGRAFRTKRWRFFDHARRLLFHFGIIQFYFRRAFKSGRWMQNTHNHG